MELTAVVNDKHHIKAKTVTALKRAASRVANFDNNPFDEMKIRWNGYHPEFGYAPRNGIIMQRWNKKYPNNTIIRGQWS